MLPLKVGQIVECQDPEQFGWLFWCGHKKRPTLRILVEDHEKKPVQPRLVGVGERNERSITTFVNGWSSSKSEFKSLTKNPLFCVTKVRVTQVLFRSVVVEVVETKAFQVANTVL